MRMQKDALAEHRTIGAEHLPAVGIVAPAAAATPRIRKGAIGPRMAR
jgi:hypothetical protein